MYLQETFCICLQLKIKIETYFFMENEFIVLDFTQQDSSLLLRGQTVHWTDSTFQLLRAIFSSNLELCHKNNGEIIGEIIAFQAVVLKSGILRKTASSASISR